MKKIFKSILLILNAVVLLLMLGSTMAGIVSPSKFIGFSLLSYGYLYLLLLNVIFVIVWLLLSSKWFLLSLAGILLKMSFIPLYFQVGGTDKVDDNQEMQMVKVLTFNAHHFRGVDFDKMESNDSNILEFLQMVDDEKPDVLAMQEYVGRGKELKLTEQLVEKGYTYKASGYENGSMTGEVIFSKLPVLDVVRIGGNSKFYADLLWNEDTVRLFCLHLDSYGLDQSDQKQMHDIKHGNVDSTTGRSTYRKFRETIIKHEEEWNLLVDYFEDSRKLAIVAGDFNDTPASYLYQKCSTLFADSYCEAGQGFSTTYHGIFTRNATFPAFRIDMVLHTNDMKAMAYRRIKSQISDHYPIVVTLVKNEK